MYSPTVGPSAGRKLMTPGGKPISSITSTNLAAMIGVSSEGFSTTVLPATMAEHDMPAIIANGKFQGGMMMPTPSGRYFNSLTSSDSGEGQRLRFGITQGLARVEIQKINRLASVSFASSQDLPAS
jgi:hypothetical protein